MVVYAEARRQASEGMGSSGHHSGGDQRSHQASAQAWSDSHERLWKRLQGYISRTEAGHLLQLLRAPAVADSAPTVRAHFTQDRGIDEEHVRDFIGMAIERAEVLRSRCLQSLR